MCHPPAEMHAAITATSLFNQSHVADSYTDLKVKWTAKLNHVRPRSDNSVFVGFAHVEDGHFISVDVILPDYPILRTVHGGEVAEIKEQSNMFSLTDQFIYEKRS